MSVNATTLSEEASEHILSCLIRKRAGEVLSSFDIEKLIQDFLERKVTDYQMSAWLATVACMGMNIDEIESLTRSYVTSGKSMTFSGRTQKIVDKHSTGGVGDKVSLIVVPIVAACGVPVTKISGRGLGHAGGTLDKLESIEGLKLSLSVSEARAVLKKVGMVMTGQSDELVPGDKATYTLRDVSGSIESIPLIAASIISKKVAIGADCLVLDVKTGSGALIEDYNETMKLAQIMVELATRFNIKCRAVISDMSQPLGYAVGNTLEVKEALKVLQGVIIPGLTELSISIAQLMLQTVDPTVSNAEAREKINKVISNGSAHQKFIEWATSQGAKKRPLVNIEKLPKAKNCEIVKAETGGWIKAINPRAIGYTALHLGNKGINKRESFDYPSGIVLHRKVGDKVCVGDSLAEIHYSSSDIENVIKNVHSAFSFCTECPVVPPTIHQII